MYFGFTFHLLVLFGNILLLKLWMDALMIDNWILTFIQTKFNINAIKNPQMTKKA
jgi:hypothetical protein